MLKHARWSYFLFYRYRKQMINKQRKLYTVTRTKQKESVSRFLSIYSSFLFIPYYFPHRYHLQKGRFAYEPLHLSVQRFKLHRPCILIRETLSARLLRVGTRLPHVTSTSYQMLQLDNTSGPLLGVSHLMTWIQGSSGSVYQYISVPY